MRRTLAILIALSFVATSTHAVANKFDEAADEQIASSREAATAYARKLVHEDLSQVLDRMFARLREYGDTLELPRLYGKFLAEIEAEFRALTAESRLEGTATANGLEQFTVRFGETIRKRFVTSWIPSVQASEYDFARAMIKGAVEDARLVCASGRSLHRGNFMTPGPEVPPLVARLRANVTPNYIGLLTGGSPVNFGYGFTSATAGSKLANRDRANAVAITTTASNVANGFYLNAQAAAVWHAVAPATNLAATSGGALGAVSNAMVVAAPYLAGVALAAVVAVHLMAQAEAAKIADRIGRARLRQMRDTADHEFVNRAYREICAPYAGVLRNVAQVLDDVDGPRRAEVLAKAHGESEAIATWQREGTEDDLRQCRIDLDEMRTVHGCVTLKSNQTLADLQPRANQPNSNCAIDPNQRAIFTLNGKCSVPAAASERKPLVDLWVKEHAAYEAKYAFARVMELTTAQIALAFEDHQSLRHRIWSENVSRIDGLQQSVQLGLERYLSLVKRTNETAASVRAFELARRWRTDFETLRNDLLAHATDVVEIVFNRREKWDLIDQLVNMRTRWGRLAGGLPLNEPLLELGRAIDSLLETVKEL